MVGTGSSAGSTASARAPSRPAVELEDAAIITTAPDTTLRTVSGTTVTTLNPEAQNFSPHPRPSPALLSRPTAALPTVKFPSNSTRQRASNITVKEPEKEFLQTQLDSCRSTIVQQETDIKKLRESQDIRNKRLLQLEVQVGFSAAQLSS